MATSLPEAATATAPTEQPVDVALFQRRLIDGTPKMLGVAITPVDLE